MKFRYNSENHTVEDTFQMAAMVDIVFILLAFFVMATRFHQPEHDLDMGYRTAAAAGQAGADDLPSNVTVQLRQVSGGVAIKLGQGDLPNNGFDELTGKLTEINMPQIGVVLHVDPKLSMELVARVMDAVLQSPMKQISVTALKSKPPPPITMAISYGGLQ